MKKNFKSFVVWGMSLVALLFFALFAVSFKNVFATIEAVARGSYYGNPAIDIIAEFIIIFGFGGISFLSAHLAYKTYKAEKVASLLSMLSIIVLVFFFTYLIANIFGLASAIIVDSNRLSGTIIELLVSLVGTVCAVLSLIFCNKDLPPLKKMTPFLVSLLVLFVVDAFAFGSRLYAYTYLITCVVFLGLVVLEWKRSSGEKEAKEAQPEEPANE